jgi:hypothetical protein
MPRVECEFGPRGQSGSLDLARRVSAAVTAGRVGSRCEARGLCMEPWDLARQ